MTPEGRIKQLIRFALKKYNVYYFMPVSYGYGPRGVDFHCVVASKGQALAFFIEAKAPNKEATDAQSQFAKDRYEQQCAITFIVNGDRSLKQLEDWLDERTRATQ